MATVSSEPPDKPDTPVNATQLANNAKGQHSGATDNDVIIVKVIAGALLAVIYWFKDEIAEGIKDLRRRVKKIGACEFYSTSEIDGSHNDNKEDKH